MEELNGLFKAWVSMDERRIVINEEGGELLLLIDYDGISPRGLINPRVEITDYMIMKLFEQMKSFIEQEKKRKEEKKNREEESFFLMDLDV